ncbi:MAG: hypothetical protein ACRDV2_17295, partial [Actinomycetes bacterium]
HQQTSSTPTTAPTANSNSKQQQQTATANSNSKQQQPVDHAILGILHERPAQRSTTSLLIMQFRGSCFARVSPDFTGPPDQEGIRPHQTKIPKAA